MSLELRDIHKHFGPVRACDGVTLAVEQGELHGLLGENGAGKSTLMKILSGFYRADSGAVILDKERLRLASSGDAIRRGVGMLHQDPLVFLPMSVLDNFILGSPGPARIERRQARRDLERIAARFDFEFDLDAPVRSLTIGERQQLEIARLLWLGVRVLILDEPTTGISAGQRDTLFATLRALAAEGLIVIFVSHKLEEVADLCHRVTVLRQGRVVGEADLPVPTGRLVEMMFGQEISPEPAAPVELGEPAVEVEEVTVREQLTTWEGLSLSVRAGEVVGLAGLEGSGQQPLLRACAGLLAARAGSIRIGGRDLTGRSYRQFLAAGVHYLPAGRLEEGLIAGASITEHFVLAGGPQDFFVDWDAAKERAAAKIGQHFIKGRPETAAEELSGGNQQRLLLAMLPEHIRLLLMQHPTRGLDIESADWVWRQLLARRGNGTAILFASADLDELLQYCDRIAVFFAGRILDVVEARQTTLEELGHLIGGTRRAEGAA